MRLNANSNIPMDPKDQRLSTEVRSKSSGKSITSIESTVFRQSSPHPGKLDIKKLQGRVGIVGSGLTNFLTDMVYPIASNKFALIKKDKIKHSILVVLDRFHDNPQEVPKLLSQLEEICQLKDKLEEICQLKDKLEAKCKNKIEFSPFNTSLITDEIKNYDKKITDKKSKLIEEFMNLCFPTIGKVINGIIRNHVLSPLIDTLADNIRTGNTVLTKEALKTKIETVVKSSSTVCARLALRISDYALNGVFRHILTREHIDIEKDEIKKIFPDFIKKVVDVIVPEKCANSIGTALIASKKLLIDPKKKESYITTLANSMRTFLTSLKDYVDTNPTKGEYFAQDLDKYTPIIADRAEHLLLIVCDRIIENPKFIEETIQELTKISTIDETEKTQKTNSLADKLIGFFFPHGADDIPLNGNLKITIYNAFIKYFKSDLFPKIAEGWDDRTSHGTLELMEKNNKPATVKAGKIVNTMLIEKIQEETNKFIPVIDSVFNAIVTEKDLLKKTIAEFQSISLLRKDSDRKVCIDKLTITLLNKTFTLDKDEITFEGDKKEMYNQIKDLLSGFILPNAIDKYRGLGDTKYFNVNIVDGIITDLCDIVAAFDASTAKPSKIICPLIDKIKVPIGEIVQKSTLIILNNLHNHLQGNPSFYVSTCHELVRIGKMPDEENKNAAIKELIDITFTALLKNGADELPIPKGLRRFVFSQIKSVLQKELQENITSFFVMEEYTIIPKSEQDDMRDNICDGTALMIQKLIKDNHDNIAIEIIKKLQKTFPSILVGESKELGPVMLKELRDAYSSRETETGLEDLMLNAIKPTLRIIISNFDISTRQNTTLGGTLLKDLFDLQKLKNKKKEEKLKELSGKLMRAFFRNNEKDLPVPQGLQSILFELLRDKGMSMIADFVADSYLRPNATIPTSSEITANGFGDLKLSPEIGKMIELAADLTVGSLNQTANDLTSKTLQALHTDLLDCDLKSNIAEDPNAVASYILNKAKDFLGEQGIEVLVPELRSRIHLSIQIGLTRLINQFKKHEEKDKNFIRNTINTFAKTTDEFFANFKEIRKTKLCKDNTAKEVWFAYFEEQKTLHPALKSPPRDEQGNIIPDHHKIEYAKKWARDIIKLVFPTPESLPLSDTIPETQRKMIYEKLPSSIALIIVKSINALCSKEALNNLIISTLEGNGTKSENNSEDFGIVGNTEHFGRIAISIGDMLLPIITKTIMPIISGLERAELSKPVQEILGDAINRGIGKVLRNASIEELLDLSSDKIQKQLSKEAVGLIKDYTDEDRKILHDAAHKLIGTQITNILQKPLNKIWSHISDNANKKYDKYYTNLNGKIQKLKTDIIDTKTLKKLGSTKKDNARRITKIFNMRMMLLAKGIQKGASVTLRFTAMILNKCTKPIVKIISWIIKGIMWIIGWLPGFNYLRRFKDIKVQEAQEIILSPAIENLVWHLAENCFDALLA